MVYNRQQSVESPYEMTSSRGDDADSAIKVYDNIDDPKTAEYTGLQAGEAGAGPDRQPATPPSLAGQQEYLELVDV